MACSKHTIWPYPTLRRTSICVAEILLLFHVLTPLLYVYPDAARVTALGGMGKHHAGRRRRRYCLRRNAGPRWGLLPEFQGPAV